MFVYEDLDLRLQSDGDQFVVHARHGSQTAIERLDLDQAVFGDLLHIEGADAKLIHDRGADLFDALIRGRVRDLYQQGRGRSMTDFRSGFRLRLIFNARDERVRRLIAVPWEILRDGSADADDCLALDARRPVVRTIETFEPPLGDFDEPLKRVLLALADPDGRSRLDLGGESDRVKKALARMGIHPHVVEHTRRDTLFDAIAEKNPQLVHFIGHSDIDAETGDGVLVLEDENGEADLLPGTTFASFFTGRTAPRLVVLTSCVSARQGRERPFAGIAFSLAAAGLPAVVAMQSYIRDDSAVRFTECLYRRISYGDPIEAALADSRIALRCGKKHTTDWAAPVLFVRGSAKPAPATPQEAVPIEPQRLRDHHQTVHFTVTNRNVRTQNNYGARDRDS